MVSICKKIQNMEKQNIVVLSGAGISAESGIQTFRGGNGLWDNYNVEDVASIDGWHRNRALVLEFYDKITLKMQLSYN